MSKALVTTDREEIKAWVEERGGYPARVKRTARRGGDAGLLRIDYPGYSGQASLEKISWDEWFETFDSSKLAFLYQDEVGAGQTSRFSKLISRDSKAGGGSARRTARRSGSERGGRAAARRNGAKAGARTSAKKRSASTTGSTKKKSASARRGGTNGRGEGATTTRSSATRSTKTGTTSRTKKRASSATPRKNASSTRGAKATTTKRAAKRTPTAASSATKGRSANGRTTVKAQASGMSKGGSKGTRKKATLHPSESSRVDVRS